MSYVGTWQITIRVSIHKTLGGSVEGKLVKDNSWSEKFLDGRAHHLHQNWSSSLCSCVLYRHKAFGFMIWASGSFMIRNFSLERWRSFLRSVLLAALQLLACVGRFYLVSATATTSWLIVLLGFNTLFRLTLKNQMQNKTELLHSAGAHCP